MTSPPASRVVLTTGASSGLGLVTAIEIARHGFRSVGTARSEAKAAMVAEAAADAGVEVETVLLDVTDAERCREVIEELRPWGLVNNAGILDLQAVEDVDDAAARHYLETLVVGPMRLARLAVPHMRERGEGRIVQVSSLAGRVTMPFLGWYQGAKRALEGVSDALRMEVASAGVAVVIVEPGQFKTAMLEELSTPASLESTYAEGYRLAARRWREMSWLWGKPQEAASVIVHALTTRYPRARYQAGLDARVGSLTDQFVPTLLKDRLKRTLYGL
jgi:NAD(P)-dependent dehydrogenase (short-subunit alcohol dehydrogenase family)